MTVGCKRYENLLRLSVFTAFALLMLLVQSCFFGGGGSEDALLVDPAQKLFVRLGPQNYGLSGTMSSLTLTRSRSESPVVGQVSFMGQDAQFQYARTSEPKFSDVIKARYETSTAGQVTLRAYALTSDSPVDFATEQTVRFFENILRRTPGSIEEVRYVLNAFSGALDRSCMKGIALPGIDALLRAANNAFYQSPEFNDLVARYALTYTQINSLAQINNAPSATGSPPTSDFLPTPFVVPENVTFNLMITPFEPDNDYIVSTWVVDGTNLQSDPSLQSIFADIRTGNPEVPALFHLPTRLQFTTNYEMSSRVNTRTFSLQLHLCDGGPKRVYLYNASVGDANRAPEFTVVPQANVPVQIGVETTFELSAKDIDGDIITFAMSPDSSIYTEATVFAKQGGFDENKKPNGLFISKSPLGNRDVTDAARRPQIGDPWFEVPRAATTVLPSKMEFIRGDLNCAVQPPNPIDCPDKVRIYGLDTDPAVYREADVEHSFSLNPISGLKETMLFKIKNINVETPVNLPGATMFCAAKESSYYYNYSLDIACNLDHYPKNFRRDGEWILSMRCPNNPDEIPTGSLMSPRCKFPEGNYAVAPNALGETTRATMKFSVRLEPFQALQQTFSQAISVFDDRGAFNTIVVNFQLSQPLTLLAPLWKQLDLFEHHVRSSFNPSDPIEFSRNAANNDIKFSQFLPYANMNPPFNPAYPENDSYRKGTLVKFAQRAPFNLDKPEWWQHIRWELRDDLSNSDPNLALFAGKKFFRFMTDSPDSPGNKLLLGTGTVNGGVMEGRLRAPFDPKPATGPVSQAAASSVYKYEVLATHTGPQDYPKYYFDFKIAHGRGYGLDLFCRANLNYNRGALYPNGPATTNFPIDSDWMLTCAPTRPELDLPAAGSLRVSYGVDAFFNESIPLALGTGSTYMGQSSAAAASTYWTFQSCRYGRGSPGTQGTNGQNCPLSFIDNSLPLMSNDSKNRIRLSWSSFRVMQFSPVDWAADDVYDPSSTSDTSVDIAIKHGTSAFLAVPNTVRAKIYPRSRRIALPTTWTGSGSNPFAPFYKWCRYSFRQQMTVLVLTCRQTAPTPDTSANYPGVMDNSEPTAGQPYITLQWRIAPWIWDIPNDVRTFVGIPKVVLSKSAAPVVQGQAQSLTDATFKVPAEKFKMLAFKVAYDNTAWETPRKENAPLRPRLKSYEVSVGGSPINNNNPSIWEPASDGSGELSAWTDGTLTNSLNLNAVGAPRLEPNEYLVVWKPTAPGLYNFKFTLEQPSRISGEPALLQAFDVKVDAENYVMEPQLTIQDLGIREPTGPAAQEFRENLDPDVVVGGTNIAPLPGSQPAVKLWINEGISKYTIKENSFTGINSILKVRSERPEISAFWLVDDTGKLVDPSKLNWEQNFPFTLSGGQWQIKPNQVIISRRDGGAANPNQDDLTPGLAVNGVGNTFTMVTANTSALQPGGTFLILNDPASDIRRYFEFQLKPTAASATTNYRAQWLAGALSGDSSNDLLIEGLNLVTMGTQVGLNASCRLFWSYPSGGLKNQTTTAVSKFFCTQGNTFSPSPALTTPPSIDSDVTDAVFAASGVTAFEAKYDILFAGAVTHSLRSIANNNALAVVPPDTLLSGPVGNMRWGAPSLTASEAVSGFKAVIAITDGLNLIYKPIQFTSLQTDTSSLGPSNSSTVVAGQTIQACPTSMTTLIQQIIPQGGDPLAAAIDFKCALPTFSSDGNSAANLYHTLLDVTTDPMDIGGALTRLVPEDNYELQPFSVNSAQWTAYPSDPAFQPKVEYLPGTGGNRYIFSWKIPGMERVNVRDRLANFAFNPGLDFKRKIYANDLATQNFFYATNRALFSLGAYTQIIDGNRDRIKFYASAPADIASSWLKLPIKIGEPNIPPCLVGPGYASTLNGMAPGTATGLACQDSASLMSEYLVPGMRWIDPGSIVYLNNDPATNHILQFTVNYDQAEVWQMPSGPAAWNYVFEDDQVRIPLLSYDQNQSAGANQNLLQWTILSGPSDYSFLTASIHNNLRIDTLVVNPRDSNLPRNTTTGDVLTIIAENSDQGSGASDSANLRETIKLRVWDKNKKPAANIPTNVVHNGSNTARTFAITASDADGLDVVNLEYIGSSVDGLPTPIINSSGMPNNKTYTVTFTDIVDLATVPEVLFYFRMTDVPWWQTAPNGAAYHSNYPAAFVSNLDPAPIQYVTVTSRLSGPPSINHQNPRLTRVYRNQTYVEPIVVNNPNNYPVTCSQGPQWPSLPAGVSVPGNPFEIPQIVTEPASGNVLPHTTACVIKWRPTHTDWLTAGSNKQIAIAVQLVGGAQTYNLAQNWTFVFQGTVVPPGVSPRPRFLTPTPVTMSVLNETPFNPGDPTPLYVMDELDNNALTFDIQNLQTGDYSYVWYVDGKPVSSGASYSAAGPNVIRYIYRSSIFDAGVHTVSAFVRESTVIPSVSLPVQFESGYNIFTAQVFVRNTLPSASSSDFLSLDSTSEKYSVFSLFPFISTNASGQEELVMAGLKNRVRISPSENFFEKALPYIGSQDWSGTQTYFGSTPMFSAADLSGLTALQPNGAARFLLHLYAGPFVGSTTDAFQSQFNFGGSPNSTTIGNKPRLDVSKATDSRFRGRQVHNTRIDATHSAQIDFSATSGNLTIYNNDGITISLPGSQPTWISTFNSIRSVIGTGTGALVIRARAAAVDPYHFFLVVNPLVNNPSIVDLNVRPSSPLHPIVAGNMWVAPCQTTGCAPQEVQFGALVYTTAAPSSDNFIHGILDTVTGAVRSGNTAGGNTVFVPVPANQYSGSASMQHLGHLFPEQSGANPNNHVFIVINQGSAEYISVDLGSNTAYPQGIMGAEFSTLSCLDTTFMCYVGDGGNEGVWTLP